MKDFWKVLKRFAAPYKKYLAGSIVLNLFSAVFNIFSFALLIPILNILFKMDTNVYEFMPWDGMPSKEQLAYRAMGRLHNASYPWSRIRSHDPP